MVLKITTFIVVGFKICVKYEVPATVVERMCSAVRTSMFWFTKICFFENNGTGNTGRTTSIFYFNMYFVDDIIGIRVCVDSLIRLKKCFALEMIYLQYGSMRSPRGKSSSTYEERLCITIASPLLNETGC